VDYYIPSDDLLDAMKSRFLTPPEGQYETVRKGKRWRQDMQIEGMQFDQREDNAKMQKLQVRFRVPATASANAGRGFTEFFDFDFEAMENGTPANMVMRTTINYNNLVSLMGAIGGVDGPVVPGQIAANADEYRGQLCSAQIVVGPDKTGVERQSVSNYNRPIDEM